MYENKKKSTYGAGSGGELLLESIEATEGGFNGSSQLASWFAWALWRHALPEEAMVLVTTTNVAQTLTELFCISATP